MLLWQNYNNYSLQAAQIKKLQAAAARFLAAVGTQKKEKMKKDVKVAVS